MPPRIIAGLPIPNNAAFRLNAHSERGYVGLDNSGQLQPAAADGAQWFQDHIEIGYYERPGSEKSHAVFRLPYGGSMLPSWPLNRLLKRDVGVFQIGKNTGSRTRSGDFGGNLEILPPNALYSMGRIVVGNTQSQKLFDFLESQEYQPPLSSTLLGLTLGMSMKYSGSLALQMK
ncbi:MAG: hypothetical protein IPG76_22865 [Acidobacteria bacterium]|nr:hypothetical protein [Acidobacteriota bacterium]